MGRYTHEAHPGFTRMKFISRSPSCCHPDIQQKYFPLKMKPPDFRTLFVAVWEENSNKKGTAKTYHLYPTQVFPHMVQPLLHFISFWHQLPCCSPRTYQAMSEGLILFSMSSTAISTPLPLISFLVFFPPPWSSTHLISSALTFLSLGWTSSWLDEI